MDHEEFKQARKELGLSIAQAAKVLGPVEAPYSADHVRSWEMSPDRSTAKPVPKAVQRLMKVYLDGYRPPDWPKSED